MIVDVTALSLRARLALALRLFAGYCELRGLHHPEVAAYLDYLWRFIGMPGSSEAFGRWTADEPPLVGAGLGWEYPPGFVGLLADCGVPEREFRRVLGYTTEILFGSLYGAADEAGSRRFLTELANVVAPLGVRFPDTEPFAGSRWSDGGGWGAVPSVEELGVWRARTDTEPGPGATPAR